MGAALALGVALTPAAAHADDVRHDLAFGSIEGEIALGVATSASTLFFLLPQLHSSWGPAMPAPRDPYADDLSDFTGSIGGSMLQLGVGYALEAGYLELKGSADPGLYALEAAAVETEALLFASGMTGLIKRLAGRCRPRAYHEGRCTEFDAFPSGHVSAVSSFAGARLVRAALTPADGASSLRLASFAFAEAAMVATAYLRVEAGAHSWDDVLVGAILGHLAGITIALMHPMVPARRVDDPNQLGAPSLGTGAQAPMFSFGAPF
ncbi:MAG: phosphatase PAP2 family protein [Polyangiaceae bacterium]